MPDNRRTRIIKPVFRGLSLLTIPIGMNLPSVREREGGMSGVKVPKLITTPFQGHDAVLVHISSLFTLSKHCIPTNKS